MKACPNCNKPIHFVRKQEERYKTEDGEVVKVKEDLKCYNCNEWIPKSDVIERDRNQKYWAKDRKKKRHIDDSDLIKKEELLQKLENIKSRTVFRDRALISFLYLTACRIEEVVGLVNQSTRELLIQPIRMNQITFETLNQHLFMVISNVPTLKRKLKGKDEYGNEIRRIPRRTVGILVESDKEFVMHIQMYLDSRKEENPNLPLFKMTYQRAWQISNKIKLNEDLRSFNHYWRHLRLSHLAGDYGFTDMQLQQYVGWANTNMASKYVHLDWKSLGEKMIYGFSNKNKTIGDNEK